MNPSSASSETRVAVLVDCDNVTPEVLEYALRVIAQFGRVVLRRGYKNHGPPVHKCRMYYVRAEVEVSHRHPASKLSKSGDPRVFPFTDYHKFQRLKCELRR